MPEILGRRWIISGVPSINSLKTSTDFPRNPGDQLQGGSQWTFSPILETAWGDSTLNLRAILPGVVQQDLKVSVQNNQLIIEGERRAPETFKNNAHAQLAYGKFYAAVTLPNGLNVDKLNARLQDGILDVQIPVSEQMKPRQIQIQSGESRKSISA